MHVRCPHCHSPIDVSDGMSLAEIECHSCGSSFSLIGGDATATHRPKTRQLGQFELVRELGIGNFGSVWMAHDTELDRTVAVKIPRKVSWTSRRRRNSCAMRSCRPASTSEHRRCSRDWP